MSFVVVATDNVYIYKNVLYMYTTISNKVANLFSARQYPKHIIESANKDVHSIHRGDILRPSSKTVSPDRIPLILPFHPSIYPLRRIILRHYKTLMTDQDTNDIFKLLSITSYKREWLHTNEMAT